MEAGGGVVNPNPKIRFPGDDRELEAVDVAIVMESTYPFLRGGVSAVVHDIITHNPEFTYGIIHIAWDSQRPREDLYGVPDNVAWIDVVYLSLEENHDAFSAAVHDRTGWGKRSDEEVTRRFVSALRSGIEGDPDSLWRLWEESVNPVTRTWRLWPVIRTRAMMEAAIEAMPNHDDTTVGDLFWTVRDFFSLAYALTDRVHPPAKVYHAHTTGYASLVAAVAARQHDGAFLLTEHNLYVRDTVNTLLGRTMSLPVTRESHLELPTNTPDYLWTRWWIEMGAILYPSTDHITYLYPTAIEEAAALGGDPTKSEVLPNGMRWEDFAEGRAIREEALAEIAAGVRKQWRFACIARVVPIKGIHELLSSISTLVRGGHEDIIIDVLGPTNHLPEYYEECLDYARELGIEDYVNFEGTVNVRELLHTYDGLVLASFNEGQPIVVLESMACGLPIVGTNVGGMDELVCLPLPGPDGEVVGPCGVLVSPGDTEALARGIASVVESGELYKTWHLNALARLRGTFLMPTVMARYNAIYRRLGAGSPEVVRNRTADLGRGSEDIVSSTSVAELRRDYPKRRWLRGRKQDRGRRMRAGAQRSAAIRNCVEKVTGGVRDAGGATARAAGRAVLRVLGR
nr:GT4 family glycosyltransferase PelF [Corynebacterium antarcticum]